MRNLLTSLVCVTCIGLPVESKAIGSTEAGVLYGVFGTLVFQQITKNPKQSEYYPHNPTGEFPPFRCSGNSVECSFQRGVWEKQREEWLKAKDTAYRCGRYGKCE